MLIPLPRPRPWGPERVRPCVPPRRPPPFTGAPYGVAPPRTPLGSWVGGTSHPCGPTSTVTLYGALPNVPAAAWLQASGLTTCAGCSKLIAIGILQGWHRRCWARQQREAGAVADEAARAGTRLEPPDAAEEASLPTFEIVARAVTPTLEVCPEEALPLVDTEYRRLLANVVLLSRRDAWEGMDLPPGSLDPALAEARRVARAAWLELWMFPEACLGSPKKGGHSRYARNVAALRTRLERWRAGDRVALWSEAVAAGPGAVATAERPPDAGRDQRARQGQALHYAALNMPAKAAQRLMSQGFAPADDAALASMQAKFPAPRAAGAPDLAPPPTS